MRDGGVRRSRPTPSSLAKDQAILDAAEAVLAHDGWAALQFARVAADAGVSVQALRTRYVDRLGLAQTLWRERCGPALVDGLGTLVAASSGAVADLTAALHAFAQPSLRLRGAVELIVVSTHEPALHTMVARTCEESLTPWLVPARGGPTRTAAARHAFLFALGLGLVILSYTTASSPLDLSQEAARIAPALTSDVAPARLPAQQADHLDKEAVFGTGDPAWDALLQATLDQVGTVGFDRATVSGIAHAAGYTEGLLFARYATKRDLFVDATARMTEPATRLNQAMSDDLAKRYSWGISDAVMMREFMRPGRERVRTIVLEQYRLASHQPDVQAVVEGGSAPTATMAASHVVEDPEHLPARTLVERSLGIGAPLLAAIDPEAWSLPYDVVTVPLLDH